MTVILFLSSDSFNILFVFSVNILMKIYFSVLSLVFDDVLQIKINIELEIKKLTARPKLKSLYFTQFS